VAGSSSIRTNSRVVKGRVVKAYYNSYTRGRRSKEVKECKESKVEFIYYTFYCKILCFYCLQTGSAYNVKAVNTANTPLSCNSSVAVNTPLPYNSSVAVNTTLLYYKVEEF
jgi:hypothetical protein